MDDADDKMYRTETVADCFQVMDESDRVVLVCRDKGSADEYVVLLNNAYRKGFKVGYREGKRLGK